MKLGEKNAGVMRAREVRRKRARQAVTQALFWVGIPTLIAAIYYGGIASPQYQSISMVSVQSNDAGGTSFEPLAALLPPAGAGRDTLLVREYIRSRDLVKLLIDNDGLREHYSDPHEDWLSRLSANASLEATYHYYLDKVNVEHDQASGTLTIKVLAFSGEKAQQLNKAIIAAAEKMVNQLTERARQDRIRVAEEAVDKNGARLAKAREALLELQHQRGEIDPTKEAETILKVKGELEGQLATAKAELDSLEAVMRGDAPQVLQQRRKVSSLQRQIDRQTSRLTDAKSGGVNSSIASFEPAFIQKELAEKAYETALKTLEIARVEASRQHRYLVTISSPSLPDVATHPKRLWKIATVFMISLSLLGVLGLLMATIREHAKF